ncbi:MAG: sigma-70 family RNA polymerase sigma factor [Bacteroidia bacterium]|nr:sigma-70 family RNA polymerase sigma factor [Bacteroidia bacterium]
MTKISAFENYADTEIIAKILAGETRLYELLIRRNNPFLYRVGRSYNYSHHDTEDLMQETYVSAFYSLSDFQGKSSFKTWITRIMLNKCYHKKQKHSYKKETVAEDLILEKNKTMFDNPSNTDKNIINKELSHVLEKALESIPDEYRMVFTLRELNGLSTSETGELMSITESNVKVRLNRAKSMLRTFIVSQYSAEDIYEFNLVYCNRIVENVMSRINSSQ